MIPSSVASMSRQPRARVSRWLAPVCLGATLVALGVAACSVPEFEFPPAPTPGMAGSGSMVPTVTDPCENKQIDADTGETDFDCGGACAPCGVGQHCVDAPDCQAELLCHEGMEVSASRAAVWQPRETLDVQRQIHTHS